MKKFLLALIMCNALSLSLSAKAKEQALSAQEWNAKHFSYLDQEEKTILILTIKTVQDCFNQFELAIDKGSEQLLDAYGALLGTYQHFVQLITPSLDSYRNKQALIAATVVLPSLEDIQSVMQKVLPEQPKNEREIKRAINKGLRDKKIKESLKALTKEKNIQLRSYTQFIEQEYSELIKQLDDATAQAQVLLQSMQ